MKWLQREEWREPFNELLALHMGEACADAGVAIENLPAVIGEDSVGVLWGCVFEDFLTTNSRTVATSSMITESGAVGTRAYRANDIWRRFAHR